MKKIFVFIAVFCCTMTLKAQQVGDTFSDAKGEYKIISLDPKEVQLTKAKNPADSGTIDYGTATYSGSTYEITSVKTNAFSGIVENGNAFVFGKLKAMEAKAFMTTDCNYSIDMTGSTLTTIPSYAFFGSNFKYITLPNSVTQIEDNAFNSSRRLITINLDNVQYIGKDAFNGCGQLSGNNHYYDINLQNAVQIGESAFYGCSNMVLKNNSLSCATQIGSNAFHGCYRLSSVSMPMVTTIGSGAFMDCSNLGRIALPQCLRTVNGDAFYGCLLSSLTLYNTVESFGNSYQTMANDGSVTMQIADWANDNALRNNSNIPMAIHYKYCGENVTGDYTLPDDLTALGQGALYHCDGLTAVTLPAILSQIGAKAFAKCSSLVAIISNATTAPTVANANAFSEVDKTIPVTIPDDVNTYFSYLHATGWEDFTNYQVSLSTIQGAAVMELVHTGGNNPSQAVLAIIYEYSNQINAATDKAGVETAMQAGIADIVAQLYDDRGVVKIGNFHYILDAENHTATVTYGGCEADGYATPEYTGNMAIPASVTDADGTAYRVTMIGDHAFQNCSGLTAITFTDNLVTIGDHAFFNSTGLKNIIIPQSVTQIGHYAFMNCEKLKTIEFHGIYTSLQIGHYSFVSCIGLTSILCQQVTPPTIESNTFGGDTPHDIPVTVPTASLASYRQSLWNVFSNIKTQASLDEAKQQAVGAITEIIRPYSSIHYLAQTALTFCLEIQAASTVEEVNALRTEYVTGLTYAIPAYQAGESEAFGEMGTECDDCPAVDVSKGTKTIRLYAPDKVEFIKVAGAE